MNSNKTTILAIIATVISITAAGLSICSMLQKNSDPAAAAETQEQDIQYVLYLGTNDKDTNEPVFDPDEAKEHLDAVLTKHFEGFTIQEARGGWTNEDGTVCHEYTLIIHLSDTTMDKIHAACDDLIREYNQSSILIQQNSSITEFYDGSAT
ncbi:MAG: DUF3574 domain-containing protein [Clostridiales bacterium]|nr:DUF3574 domain-containing protein [Clostridiales bacterium]